MKKKYVKPTYRIVPLRKNMILCASAEPTRKAYNSGNWDGDTDDEFL